MTDIIFWIIMLFGLRGLHNWFLSVLALAHSATPSTPRAGPVPAEPEAAAPASDWASAKQDSSHFQV